MRTQAEIRRQVQELLVRELGRRLARVGERLPEHCRHNHRQPLDSRKLVDGEKNPHYNRVSRGVDGDGRALPVLQTIGLCRLDDPDKHLTICEEPIDAKRCPLFDPSKTHEQVYESFLDQLREPVWMQENLPEVHALLWVLGDLGTPPIPWWRRLLLRLRKAPPEPLAPPFDPSKLLPPPSHGSVGS
jgi:hypothetical protein